MKVQSSVTGKCYETDECVFIVNPLQVYKYLINDAAPLDILAGEDNKIVYVYNRKLTHDLYDRWCKRELYIPINQQFKGGTTNENKS